MTVLILFLILADIVSKDARSLLSGLITSADGTVLLVKGCAIAYPFDINWFIPERFTMTVLPRLLQPQAKRNL